MIWSGQRTNTDEEKCNLPVVKEYRLPCVQKQIEMFSAERMILQWPDGTAGNLIRLYVYQIVMHALSHYRTPGTIWSPQGFSRFTVCRRGRLRCWCGEALLNTNKHLGLHTCCPALCSVASMMIWALLRGTRGHRNWTTKKVTER